MMHPPGPRIRPGDVVRAVADELESAGVRVLDVRACSRVGLLLVSGELVVWCWGRLLRWHHQGQPVTWPAGDAYGAARRLAEAVEAGPSRM
jgi:hypothetical protein